MLVKSGAYCNQDTSQSAMHLVTMPQKIVEAHNHKLWPTSTVLRSEAARASVHSLGVRHSLQSDKQTHATDTRCPPTQLEESPDDGNLDDVQHFEAFRHMVRPVPEMVGASATYTGRGFFTVVLPGTITTRVPMMPDFSTWRQPPRDLKYDEADVWLLNVDARPCT